MENPNQSMSHPSPVAVQRYHHQMQSGMWNGNKTLPSNTGTNANMEPYSQQMNHTQYYQPQYPPQANDMNRYVTPTSKEQSSTVEFSQYSTTRQTAYPRTVPAQSYPSNGKASNINNMYYNNAATSKTYTSNNIHPSKQYVNSNLAARQNPSVMPQSSQVQRNCATPLPQMPQYTEHNNYPVQNMYMSNYNMHSTVESDQSYMMQSSISSPMMSAQDSFSHSSIPLNQVSQVSSIPTPPETTLTRDGLSTVDSATNEMSSDSLKTNMANSFALPGSVASHMPNSMSTAISVSNNTMLSNRNIGNTLQSPANLDEGSQASSASASSSIPDEQNSIKANSKPNFSYPPTPNTLSSPGAASMSSFHDDLECISSPSWPKTPASPVANSNYEFANIKRPENLLKLYTLSDEPDRRYFLDKLIVFNEDRGSPITQCPTISKQPLDVFRVYLTVKERGGFVEVTNSKRWKDIAGAIGVGASSSAAYTLRKQYMKLLLPFECKFDRGGVDPQPIINMVEASSRKKGKNSPGSYANTNPYGQGYPQTMERYPSGYQGSYSSRYQCNNNSMDYQCPPNAMNCSPTGNASQSAVGMQNHYNQYPQNPSSYRYYPGSNNPAISGYSGKNVTNSTSDNICRYGRNATSTPVPQEQSYFTSQYINQQQEPNNQGSYSSNRGFTTSDSVSNQTTNDLDSIGNYSISDVLTIKSDRIQNPEAENYGNLDIDSSLMTSDVSLENKASFNSSYNSVNKNVPVDPMLSHSKQFAPGPNSTHSYNQTMVDNSMNKAPSSYYSESPAVSSYPSSTQYVKNITSSYPNNQKLPYSGEYQRKEQMQSGQYASYSDAHKESYRGSEGPPNSQKERCSTDPATKGYNQYNFNVPKNTSYGYPQQNMGKDSSFNNQGNNRTQKGWPIEQNHQFQHVGPRPNFKNQMNAPNSKQLADTTKPRKSWLSFQNQNIQNQNKHAPNSLVNQSYISGKGQISNTLPAIQANQLSIKKPLEFPPNTVESVKPVAVKRRRCPAKRLGPIDPWRLMLSLKSGLLTECTWALDVISIMLADNTTVVYFNLDHLPGLLTVLVDHYRCFLNKIFDIAYDLELGFKSSSEENADIGSSLKDTGWEGKIKILDAPNFTYVTRHNKKVEILYDEALFLIDPQRSWDIYEGFSVSAEHWQKGGGDMTAHIQTSYLQETKKVKFNRTLETKNEKSVEVTAVKNKSNILKSSLLYKGEPIVVLKKFNFNSNKVTLLSDSNSEADTDDSCSIISISSNLDKKSDILENKNVNLEKSCNDTLDNKSDVVDKKEDILEKRVDQKEDNLDSVIIKLENSDVLENVTPIPIGVNEESNCLANLNVDSEVKTENLIEEKITTDMMELNTKEKPPQIRGSLSSRKRFLCENLEDEAYCFDEPALCVVNDSQEMLSRRCVAVSTILRNLSFVPGNDIIMSKNSGVLILLGRLLLLHHEHKPVKNSHHKYEKEVDNSNTWNDSCTSLKDKQDWWWGTLKVLRDNTLVILSNISGHLDLSPFPEEVSLPILDGLLHWVICPSSYAQDPLPSRSPSSVLSPQRLSLETLCKLSVLSNNIDLIIATPPWSRIENVLSFLIKSLSLGTDQIVREFAVVLLSNISKGDVLAARTIAENSSGIPYLIAFIEEAESNAFQIASAQGTKKLRDKPELMGTTPGMVQTAANTLKNLAIVPENRGIFMRYQSRLLSLVMSQVMDHELSEIIADVLFYCSEDVGNFVISLPIS